MRGTRQRWLGGLQQQLALSGRDVDLVDMTQTLSNLVLPARWPGREAASVPAASCSGSWPCSRVALSWSPAAISTGHILAAPSSINSALLALCGAMIVLTSCTSSVGARNVGNASALAWRPATAVGLQPASRPPDGRDADIEQPSLVGAMAWARGRQCAGCLLLQLLAMLTRRGVLVAGSDIDRPYLRRVLIEESSPSG